MTERRLLRIGAAAAFVGAIAAIVLLAVIPVEDEEYIDAPAAAFQEIASNAFWIPWSTLLLLSMLLILGGLGAISRSMTGDRGEVWSRAGFIAAAVGAAVGVVLMGVDGTALKKAAESWVNASAPDKAAAFSAAEALAGISLGLAALWVTVFFGLVGALYGLAISVGNRYPRWLGWIWILWGLGSMGLGLASRYMTSPDRADIPDALWIFALLELLWTAVMGVFLWRRAGTTQ